MTYSILIVDDSRPMRSAVKRTIARSGVRDLNIFEAQNGKEALGVIENTRIDLIITDYNMPVMDGLEFTKELKERPKFKDIPVILMTGEVNEAKLEKLKNAGVAAHITKDIIPEKFKDLLSSLMLNYVG